MAAIANYYGFENAIYAAIEAGVDIIIIANTAVYNEDAFAHAVVFIKQLVKKGKLTEARIDESYQRISRLKNKFLTLKTLSNLNNQRKL